ncbi:MAG TPA: alpha/beta hydrolase [Firmicutes bacterium]|nr:alpha/beta hydrolase [Bacillota bacterium]
MYKYKDIEINYKDIGLKDGSPIVYLHGWGQNIEMMEPIAKPFKESHRLIIIDLPGFGLSEEPTTIWSLEDYADMVHELLKELNITKPNIIGHSFGGKISIVYASKYQVSRLILLASPFKVKITKPTMKMKILKTAKKIPGLSGVAEKMKKVMGSTDYKNATPRMRDILVKHVNTDITENAKKIQCPTFIIWGDKDEAVSVNDAYELEKVIKDCGLTIYPGCTHYAYLERLNQTIAIINSFIK